MMPSSSFWRYKVHQHIHNRSQLARALNETGVSLRGNFHP